MNAAAEDIPARVGELIRVGTVAALDLAQARCRVLYGDPDDEGGGATTGWIRWLAARSGGTRTWSPPSLGEQVLLIVPDGQIGSAVALPGLVRDMFPPPGNSSTEIIEFADGARLSYDPDNHELVADLPAGGTALVTAPGGLTIDAAGGITLRGDVAIEGALTVTETIVAQGNVTGDGVSLKNHTHGGVQGGGGNSGPPS